MLQIPEFVFLQEFEKNTESASEIIERNLENLPEIYFYCVIDSTKENKLLSQIKTLQKKYSNLIYLKVREAKTKNKKDLLQKCLLLSSKKSLGENKYIFWLEEFDVLDSGEIISFLVIYLKSSEKKQVYFFERESSFDLISKKTFCLKDNLFENLFIENNFLELLAEHRILSLQEENFSKEEINSKVIKCLDEKSFLELEKVKHKNYIYKKEFKSLKIKSEKSFWKKLYLFLLY